MMAVKDNIEMMPPINIYNMLRRTEKPRELYRLLYNPSLYVSKKYSLEKAALLVERLREGYEWSQPKIIKVKGRTIHIPNDDDKNLASVLRRFLDAFYRDSFVDNVYGFGPGKGPAASIGYLYGWNEASGGNIVSVNHFDIVSCFDSIDRNRLANLVDDSTDDDRFKDLIFSHLDVHQWVEKGLPTGSPLSPTLCDLYLSEMDKKLSQFRLYMRFVDNILIGLWGKNTSKVYSDIEQYVQSVANEIGLEVKRKTNKYLGAELHVIDGTLFIARPAKYDLTMIPYYEGMGI